MPGLEGLSMLFLSMLLVVVTLMLEEGPLITLFLSLLTVASMLCLGATTDFLGVDSAPKLEVSSMLYLG